ncbi:MAG: ABC transporter substrate-binding protein [Magnetospiraceae bacterium]
MKRFWIGIAAAWLLMGLQPAQAETPTLKIGVLKFGTVNWELDVIQHHGLDAQQGYALEVYPLAGKQATAIALQAGEVDAIVTDWIWVSRQRNMGRDYTFIPYSRIVGGVIVGRDSGIQTLEDLAGKKIGIAGGPVDKSWLLVRALAEQRHGLDLQKSAETVFGAPPLLSKKLAQGELDAVITFWHFAARLEAKGYHRLLSVNDAVTELGLQADVPMLGYVFSGDFVRAYPDVVNGFAGSSRAAKKILAESDAEWDRLRPLTNAPDEATLAALREGYRAGIPETWGGDQQQAAATLFEVLAALGGEKLVGPQPTLAVGTFLPGYAF